MLQVDNIVDSAAQLLQAVEDGKDIPKQESETLSKKRKLLKGEKWQTYRLTRGSHFSLERKRQATDLTMEMLQKGTWKDQEFKPYNFKALGLLPQCGHLHPLLKVGIVRPGSIA